MRLADFGDIDQHTIEDEELTSLNFLLVSERNGPS